MKILLIATVLFLSCKKEPVQKDITINSMCFIKSVGKYLVQCSATNIQPGYFYGFYILGTDTIYRINLENQFPSTGNFRVDLFTGVDSCTGEKGIVEVVNNNEVVKANTTCIECYTKNN